MAERESIGCQGDLRIVVINRRVDRWGVVRYEVFLNRRLDGRMSVYRVFKSDGPNDETATYWKAFSYACEQERKARKVAEELEAEEEAKRKESLQRLAIEKKLCEVMEKLGNRLEKWSDNLIPKPALTSESQAEIASLRFSHDSQDYDIRAGKQLYRVRLYPFGGHPEVAKIEKAKS